MDALSEVLRVVRLSGAIHFRGDFTEPWAFSTFPPEMLAARLKVPEGSVTPFHVFIDGSCLLGQPEAGRPVRPRRLITTL